MISYGATYVSNVRDYSAPGVDLDARALLDRNAVIKIMRRLRGEKFIAMRTANAPRIIQAAQENRP